MAEEPATKRILACPFSFLISVETRGDKQCHKIREVHPWTVPSAWSQDLEKIAYCHVRQYSSHIRQPQPLSYLVSVLSFIHPFIRLEICHTESMAIAVVNDESMQILNILMKHTRQPEYIKQLSAMPVEAVSPKGHYYMRNGL
jgi:hypothetical protein